MYPLCGKQYNYTTLNSISKQCLIRLASPGSTAILVYTIYKTLNFSKIHCLRLDDAIMVEILHIVVLYIVPVPVSTEWVILRESFH